MPLERWLVVWLRIDGSHVPDIRGSWRLYDDAATAHTAAKAANRRTRPGSLVRCAAVPVTIPEELETL